MEYGRILVGNGIWGETLKVAGIWIMKLLMGRVSIVSIYYWTKNRLIKAIGHVNIGSLNDFKYFLNCEPKLIGEITRRWNSVK